MSQFRWKYSFIKAKVYHLLFGKKDSVWCARQSDSIKAMMDLRTAKLMSSLVLLHDNKRNLGCKLIQVLLSSPNN